MPFPAPVRPNFCVWQHRQSKETALTLFREFQLMKEAALTPMQILQCATANAAKLFGGETGARLGNLENGYLADLVILNSNPLDDIAHSSDIETVIKNGVAYPADSSLP